MAAPREEVKETNEAEETMKENDADERFEKPATNEHVARGVVRLLYQVSKKFQEKFEKNSGTNIRTDRKLLKEIDEKKQAQGQKLGV